MTETEQMVLDLIRVYGHIDGARHKTWLLDQIARCVLGYASPEEARTGTGAAYEQWVKECKAGTDSPDTYSYDEGIAP